MFDTTLVEIMRRALVEEHGVRVLSTNGDGLRRKFYAARRQAKDPSLEELSFTISPDNPDEVWIYRRDANGEG